MDTQESRLVSGRYRLLSPLGSGAMGTVWRARDELLGREVAVKEIAFPHGLTDAEREVLRERTRREARAAARLSHPSAVTVYDVVEEDGSPYLVLELVEARTLSEVVRHDGPLSPQASAQVGLALLGALEAAHAQGILHRDVKPSNVLVRPDGSVVLTDFGIASSTGDPSITHTGMLLGSPAYIAPERARGLEPGPPSDLWSLGATLFTAVEGRPPFGGDEPLVVVTAVVTGEHAAYDLAGPLVPVLDGLLTKDPAARLDASATRRLLQRAAASTAPATAVLAAPLAAAPAAASRTAALDLGEVREGLAAAPADPAPRTLTRPAPVTRPAVAGPPGRSRLAPVAAGLGLLVVLGGGTALLLADRGEDPATDQALPSRAPSAAPTAAAPAVEPSAAAEPTAAPSPDDGPDDDDGAETVAGLPAGWSSDTGGDGWTVGLPPGWTGRGGGEYRGPGGRTLRVTTGAGQPDAVADREQQEGSFRERHPTYERIAITPVSYRGVEAADWEFTYEGLHVLNRVFNVDGVGHSLFFQTRAGDYADAEAQFREMVEAFQPA